jgi:putative nucleotidyltransferase with HDIG domain
MKEKTEKLIKEYVESASLIKHLNGVAQAMGYFARKFSEDEEKWRLCGLLHDFDYEKFPDNHPYKGMEILKQLDFPQDIIDAVGGHASYTGIERKTLMAKTLFAVDELSGFITAVALVRPSKKIADVKVKSVKKKLKDKAFARQVNREEIAQGAKELGMEQDELISQVIEALRENPSAIGLEG